MQDWFIARGIPAVLITAEGYGESRPAVPADDGVAEPQNQRIEVLISYPQ